MIVYYFKLQESLFHMKQASFYEQRIFNYHFTITTYGRCLLLLLLLLLIIIIIIIIIRV